MYHSGAIGSLPIGASAIGSGFLSLTDTTQTVSYTATGAIGTYPIGGVSIGGTTTTNSGAGTGSGGDWIVIARRRGRR